MVKWLGVAVFGLLAAGAATGQPASSTGGASVNMCAADAYDQNGKALAGDTRAAFIKKCEAENRYPKAVDPTPAACEAKAIGKDGKPLTGGARDAFVKKCVIDTRAVQ